MTGVYDSTLMNRTLSPRAFTRWLVALYLGSAAIVTVQRGIFSFPNDYAIFRASFWNLLWGRNMYVLHTDQAHDVFKYSPTFAVLFAPLSVMPFVVGLLIWNAMNALLLAYSVVRLLPTRKANLVLLLAYLPMLRNMQSAQSNTLVAALIILAFIAFERGAQWKGALAIGVGTAVKIFPLAAVSFAIPYRHRARFGACFAVVILCLLLLPLIVTSPHSLMEQYRAWGLLEQREIQDYGASVMGLLNTWPAPGIPGWPIQIAGTIVLLLPLGFGRQLWADEPEFRLRFLASLLVYCVIFNHKAEPQSYVIALSGIAIWYAVSARAGWRSALLVIVLVLTSGLSPVPDFLKAPLSPLIRRPLPCSVAWAVMQIELFVELVRASRRSRVPGASGSAFEGPEIQEVDAQALEPSA